MDAVRKLNQKGFALVYLALMIVVLVALVSLAVDLGYVYVAKGQLQNAADAAALAGATQLGEVDEATKVTAEAQKFAKANIAAGEQVIITDQDVVIGNYNTSRDPNPFLAGGTPHNAVQVTARRTVEGATADSQGKIHTFFGGIFALMGGGGAKGWNEMGAAAAATAIRPPRPSAGILLCDQWCNPTSAVGSDIRMYWDKNDAKKAGVDDKYVVAFSEYSDQKSTDFSENSTIMQYIRGTLDSPIAAGLCGKQVYTTNGAAGKAMTALSERLATEKAKTSGYWEVIVPLVLSSSLTCDRPDVEGSTRLEDRADEKYTVTRFAKIQITAMEPKSHPYLDMKLMDCIDCANIDSVSGIFHTKLVKNNQGATDKK